MPARRSGGLPETSTCTTCTAPFEAHTSRTPTCTVCLRWSSMRSRTRRRGEAFTLTAAEFAQWMVRQERVCSYCGIDERDLGSLGVKNQTGSFVERLGVDRLDGERGYVTSNMVPACFVCNRTKSDWYTPEEMRILGRGIAAVWNVRLGRQEYAETPETATSDTSDGNVLPGNRVCGITGTSCGSCASPFEPHTPQTPLCTVCVRFRSLRGNARRVRRDGTRPDLGWDLHGFSVWFSAQPRCCAYCGVDETTLPKLGLPTQVGLPLQRLGIDRLDGTQGYLDGNAVLCCLACNRIRSATFSPLEMRLIVPSVRRLWDRRLGEGRAAHMR